MHILTLSPEHEFFLVFPCPNLFLHMKAFSLHIDRKLLDILWRFQRQVSQWLYSFQMTSVFRACECWSTHGPNAHAYDEALKPFTVLTLKLPQQKISTIF